MSKVRADQFPNYQTVFQVLFRQVSRKIPLEYPLRCVSSLQNAELELLNTSKSIENPSRNNMELPLYFFYDLATLWCRE